MVESDTAVQASKPVVPELPTVVYPAYHINLLEIAESVKALYDRDRIKRLDEIEKYIRSRVDGLGPTGCNIAKSDTVVLVKLKARDKDKDRLFWYEFRIPLK